MASLIDRKVIVELCEALELNPREVHRIRIDPDKLTVERDFVITRRGI